MQTKLTNARVQVQIAESHGEAELARARKQAEQTVVVAGSRCRGSGELAGRGEAQRIAQVGLSEAAVLLRRIASYPRSEVVRHFAAGRAAVEEHATAGAAARVRVRRAEAGTDGNGHGHGSRTGGRVVRHADQFARGRKIRLRGGSAGECDGKNRRRPGRRRIVRRSHDQEGNHLGGKQLRPEAVGRRFAVATVVT